MLAFGKKCYHASKTSIVILHWYFHTIKRPSILSSALIQIQINYLALVLTVFETFGLYLLGPELIRTKSHSGILYVIWSMVCMKSSVFTPLNKNSILYFNNLLWRQNCQASMSLGSEVKLLGFISCLHLLN